MPLVVLIGGMVAESLSLRTAVRESRLVRGESGWFRFIRRTKSPELPVILLEDAAALIGLTLALGAVTATLLTGNSAWDAAGTAMIGLLLVAVAIVLGIETKSLLLGESASSQDVRRIGEALSNGGRTQIIDLKTSHLGPDELLVAAKIAIDDRDTGLEIAAEINDAELPLRQAVPIVTMAYIEPDIDRSPRDQDEKT